MHSLSKILRRSSRLGIASSRAVHGELEIPSSLLGDKNGISVSADSRYDICHTFPRLYQTKQISSSLSFARRALSSSADVKSTGEEDELEDGFSELETVATAEGVQEGAEEDSLSEPELSGDEDGIDEALENELELSGAESGQGEGKPKKQRAYSELYKASVTTPGLSMSSFLDKWVKEGKDLSRDEIFLAMYIMRKRQMYSKALQLSEWLEANKQLDFEDREYASRLDLIAKVRGLQHAENYIQKIPESFRGELVYRTFLANCVAANNIKKAEEVFDKMKDLKFPITSFACNQLLLLYRRHDRKKIADTLLLMEKENVQPSRLTYEILIDTKGIFGDITGMEQVLETMKAEGVEVDVNIQTTLARHYAAAGHKEKAVEIMKEIEGENSEVPWWVRRSLLPLYAELGKADEVRRIWKLCGQNPRFEECLSAIIAWGKLKEVKEAEVVFDEMLQKMKKVSSKPFYALLKVYADNKMLTKGKDLVKRMADSGCTIDRLTWDALVKLYVQAGEVEKADSILSNAMQQHQMRPLYCSFMVILDEYAKRGDVHNSEKIFLRMRQAGYEARGNQYKALVLAYRNGKAPAYGMKERLKADKIHPNKFLAEQLAQVDAFRKTAMSDLLD